MSEQDTGNRHSDHGPIYVQRRRHPEALSATERRLKEAMPLALAVDMSPERSQVLDDFLWEYMGDPVRPGQFPIIERTHPHGHTYRYDRPLVNSVTEGGTLINARQASGEDVSRDYASWFVATAQIHTGQIDEWRINDIESHYSVDDGLETTLFLTRDMLDSYDGEPDVSQLSLIEAEYARQMFSQAQRQRKLRQTQLRLRQDGVAFKAFDGQFESVTGINRLVEDRKAIGSLALRHHARVDRANRPVLQIADSAS